MVSRATVFSLDSWAYSVQGCCWNKRRGHTTLLVSVQGQSVSYSLLLCSVFLLYVQVEAEWFVRVFPRSQGLKYIILWVFFVILIFFLLCAKNALKVPFQHIESSFCVLYLLQGIVHTICIMGVCWVACLHEVTDWHSRCTQPEIRISVFSQYSDNSW